MTEAPGDKPRPGPGHRAESALIGLVAGAVRILPERAAQALGSALGWLAGSVLRIRRRVVDENLARAFPEETARWRRRVAAAHYRHLGRESVALLQMQSFGPDDVLLRSRVDGLDKLQEALRPDSGAIILTGHLGNWEMGGAALAVRGVPLDVVVKHQSNPLFDARITATRQHLGMNLLFRGEATRPLLRGLGGGRAAALAADQNQHKGGVFVEFFGVPAATTRGPALLAQRTGCSVFTTFVRREPGLQPRYRMELRELELPKPEADDWTALLLRRYLSELEDVIRQVPEQYFWAHRRWKTRPPEE